MKRMSVFLTVLCGVSLPAAPARAFDQSAKWQLAKLVPADRWFGDYARQGALARTVGLVCIATTLITGLGLIATGLGLQGERRTSGRWALVFATALAVVWCAGAICLWWISAAYWKVIVAAFFAGAGTILFLMAGNSARILKLHPPPDEQNAVSDEWLQQYSRKTDE